MYQSIYVVATALLASVSAQSSSGARIAAWRDARAAVVGDSLYLQGGLFTMLYDNPPGLTTTSGGGLSQLNFSRSFNQSTNFTDLFRFQNLTVQNPLSQPHINGFMAADDNEWYTFGGQAFPKANNQTSGVIRDAVYLPNAQATNNRLGTTTEFNPNVDKSLLFTTNGGGVNIPSESLSFYFSGLKSNTTPSIQMSFTPTPGRRDVPYRLLGSMLRIDTSSYSTPEWTELPLPDDIVPRAEAMLAWIPIGIRGAFIVIGGTPYPADLDRWSSCNITDINMTATNSNSSASTMMTTLPVYDVANGTWYTQTTNGTPPPRLAHACAVVATPLDGTSHNIYVYGGFDGTSKNSTYDDVWVLSVPSFTWIKVADGNTTHGRYSHVCAKPYPDQMMVVGGTRNCREVLTGPFADVFNLNTLEWTGQYNASKGDNYTVPSVISNAIRASPTATMATGLLSLFQTRYTKTIQTWYPYPVEPANSTETQVPPPVSPAKPDSPRPGWVIPVAVVVPVVALIALGAAIWFCCRGRRDTHGSTSNKSQNRVTSWLMGHPAKSVRTDDEMTQVDDVYEATGDSTYKPTAQTRISELNNESIFNTAELSGNHTIPRRPIAQTNTDQRRYELPAEPVSVFSAPAAKAKTTTSSSTSTKEASTAVVSNASPKIDPSAPYTLSQTRSNESGISAPLNSSNLPRSATTTSNASVSARKHTAVSPERAFVSPQSSPQTSPPSSPPGISPTSPQGASVNPPMTPPQQSINSFRPLHKRNASSLSNDLPDLSGASPGQAFVSPREERRRSMVLEELPDLSGDIPDDRPDSKQGRTQWPGTL